MNAFPFAKMEATGNDFVVVYGHDLPDDLSPDCAPAICNRETGVGADGVLIVGHGTSLHDSDRTLGAAASMTLWNADGSLAEMCGNGLRCIALLLREDGHWSGRDTVSISTPAGPVRARLLSATEAGEAEIEVELSAARSVDIEPLELRAASLPIIGRRVDMGNPHFVVFREDQQVALPDLVDWAGELETNDTFPQRSNVEWAVAEAPDRVRLRVWERGVGETRACGSGACATVIAGRLSGRLGDGPCQVILPGGILQVSWAGSTADPVRLAGDAKLSYRDRWMEQQ